MAHFKKAFPGKFLQSSDLDVPIVVTIARVMPELVGSGADAEHKLIAHFTDPAAKSIVLNLTKCEAIAALVGNEDTDAWGGTRVQLSRGATRYQGKAVSCILVSAPPTGTGRSGAGVPAAALDDLDGVL